MATFGWSKAWAGCGLRSSTKILSSKRSGALWFPNTIAAFLSGPVNLQGAALGGLVKGTRTVVPAETPPMPLNKWVKFRIEARGKKLTLDVDGERAWEFADLDVERGYVGIQVEEKSFDFRNIRIQELGSESK
jgi:hypothetical protein